MTQRPKRSRASNRIRRRRPIPPGQHDAKLVNVAQPAPDRLRAEFEIKGSRSGRMLLRVDDVPTPPVPTLADRVNDRMVAVMRAREDWLNAKRTLDSLDERHEEYLSAVSRVGIKFAKYLHAAVLFRAITSVNADTAEV